MIWTWLFWKGALERVIFTAAEVLLGIMTADGFGFANFTQTETWSVVGLATAAALLKVILSGLGNGKPSATNVEAPIRSDGRPAV